MNKIIVHIGNKTYNCQLAKTEEEHRKGLMDVEYLAPDEGKHIRYLNWIPPPFRKSEPKVCRHTLASAPQKLTKKHSFKK